MSKELLKQLREMVGRTYLYRGTKYMILEVYLEEEYVKLETNNGFLKVTEKELTLFSDVSLEVLPVKGALELPAELKTEFDNCNSIANIVMDTITKVQADAKYVPQAKEINGAIKNLIDLKRVQIEMVSVFKR